LKRKGDAGPFQPSLFDQRGVIDVTSERFPGERLVVCRNPLLAEERGRKREDLLVATETELGRIRAATTRQRAPLKGQDKIALRVGAVIGHFNMAKHFTLTITDMTFTFERKTAQIAAKAAMDGLYVVRTSLPAETLSADQAVSAYKGLAAVERAFRSLKTVDLHVRPVFHWNADRVRAHVFLCMLAYYVEWHMRQKLKPILFDDEFIKAVKADRQNVVAKALWSEAAREKDSSKQSADGLPAHSSRTLIKDLVTLTLNVAHTTLNPSAKLLITTRPTTVQEKAFRLLGVTPDRT